MPLIPKTSQRNLKILAALFWFAGGGVLILKGTRLLAQAHELRPDQSGPCLAIAGGMVIGGLKAALIFRRACRQNLKRIDALQHPRIWQFYRPRFFGFLALMIATGATLSRLAHQNYPFLIGVATLDISIAVALLGSSPAFWTHKPEL